MGLSLSLRTFEESFEFIKFFIFIPLIIMIFLRLTDLSGFKWFCQFGVLVKKYPLESNISIKSNYIMISYISFLLAYFKVSIENDLSFTLLFKNAFIIFSILLIKVIVSHLLKYLFQTTIYFRQQHTTYLFFNATALSLIFVFQLAIPLESHNTYLITSYLIATIVISNIVVYFRLDSLISNSKLRIISYICISEILITFILIAWFVRA